MKKTMITLTLLIAIISGCGGGIETQNDQVETPWGNASITTGVFSLGGTFPPDMVIPDVDLMRSTAFIIDSMPCGVVAVDLDASPQAASTTYKGMICPDGIGWANSLHIFSQTRGFLLTGSSIVDFNPLDSTINAVIDLVGSTNYASSGLAVSNNKLYISFYKHDGWWSPAEEAGQVRVFDIVDGSPYLTEKTTITTTGFNTTGATTLPNGFVAITNSGTINYDYVTSIASPLTDSIIDIINTNDDSLSASINMGKAYLSFKHLAVTSASSMAYIPSATYGEVYSVDLTNYTAVNTHESNPITISGNTEGSDYLTSIAISWDDKYLFVGSGDHSKVTAVDISGAAPVVNPEAFPNAFVLGFSGDDGATELNPDGHTTGVGGIAIRPGVPGIDFTGADLWVITNTPGALANVKTYQGN